MGFGSVGVCSAVPPAWEVACSTEVSHVFCSAVNGAVDQSMDCAMILLP